MQHSHPKFIGIGGKGSGLSVLSSLLEAHPAVTGPIPSLEFFCHDCSEKNSLAHYESTLKLATATPISGECCPQYLTSREAPARIVAAYPDTKLFAVVRNPLDRAIEEYVHAQKRNVFRRT